MKKYSLLVFVGLLLTTTVSFVNAKTSIVLLGDSLSASYGMSAEEGWVNLINTNPALNKNAFTLINASISGETTSGGLSRLPAILDKTKAEHLLIELGANDGLRGLNPKMIKNNLLQMIALAQEKNIKVSLMQIKITPNYGMRYNKMFESVFTEVSQEKNIPLLPFFMESIAIDTTLMQKDGLHPNEKAQAIIANDVAINIYTLLLNNGV